MIYENKIRRALLERLPYAPEKPLETVAKELKMPALLKMHNLESPYGAGSKVSEVLRYYAAHFAQSLNRFSDGSCYNLRRAIKRHKGYALEHVVVGSGVQSLLRAVLSVFLHEGDPVLIPRFSSFEMERTVHLAGGRIVYAECAEDWSCSFESMLSKIEEQDIKLIALANPTVPVGGFAVYSRFEAFLQRTANLEIPVVVNEELVEYLAGGYKDMYALVQEHPNLMLIRSFAHAYGIADPEVAYILTGEVAAGALNAVLTPSGVSQLAQDCAEAALGDNRFLNEVLQRTQTERNRHINFCRSFRIPYIQTLSCSLSVSFGEHTGRVCHELQRYGIFVRPLDYMGLADMVNVTLGNAEQNGRYFDCLQEILTSL